MNIHARVDALEKQVGFLLLWNIISGVASVVIFFGYILSRVL